MRDVNARSGTDPNAPVIRLKGFALMGGVEVRVIGLDVPVR